jgi:hypothetical protein
MDFRSMVTAALLAGVEAAAGLLAWAEADAGEAGGRAAVLLELEPLEPLEQAVAASATAAAHAAAAIQFLIMMLPVVDGSPGAAPSAMPPVTICPLPVTTSTDRLRFRRSQMTVAVRRGGGVQVGAYGRKPAAEDRPAAARTPIKGRSSCPLSSSPGCG